MLINTSSEFVSRVRGLTKGFQKRLGSLLSVSGENSNHVKVWPLTVALNPKPTYTWKAKVRLAGRKFNLKGQGESVCCERCKYSAQIYWPRPSPRLQKK